jgi:hypothetical protein
MKTNLGFLMAVLLTGCTTTVIDMPKDGGGADTGDPDGGTVDSGTDSGVACSIKNCLGCCYGNACQTGTTAVACGSFGVQCAVCLTHQICSDQFCRVDPEGTWKVQPTDAKIATTNQGADWDFGGGAPDPYTLTWCPASAVSASATPTANDTFNPTWTTGGCVMKAKDLLLVGYAIQVWDEDVSSNDSVCGKGTIVPKESDLLAGTMNLAALPNLISLNVAFQKQ